MAVIQNAAVPPSEQNPKLATFNGGIMTEAIMSVWAHQNLDSSKQPKDPTVKPRAFKAKKRNPRCRPEHRWKTIIQQPASKATVRAVRGDQVKTQTHLQFLVCPSGKPRRQCKQSGQCEPTTWRLSHSPRPTCRNP